MPAVVVADELERFRRGDPEGVRAVYREYGGLVFAVALKSLGSRDLAEEATQQTFVKAWRAAEGLQRHGEHEPAVVAVDRAHGIGLPVPEPGEVVGRHHGAAPYRDDHGPTGGFGPPTVRR